MIFFTADHHFGHANIIRHCDRPFNSASHMDIEMARRWNTVVRQSDTVYHLGDFTLYGKKQARRYFAALAGKIKILGTHWHHDRKWLGVKYSNVEVLGPLAVLDVEGYPRITLCHYAMCKWDRGHHGAWHLYGHSHGRFINGGKSLDVGVDAWNFAPVPLSKIAKIMETK